jgi:hypothetical protein
MKEGLAAIVRVFPFERFAEIQYGIGERQLSVLDASAVHDVFGDERTQSPTLIQLAHQQQTTIGSDARSLEIDSQRGIEGELKGLVLRLTHWIEASVRGVRLLSKPDEYWRGPNHTTTNTDFKKEMWANWKLAFIPFQRNHDLGHNTIEVCPRSVSLCSAQLAVRKESSTSHYLVLPRAFASCGLQCQALANKWRRKSRPSVVGRRSPTLTKQS